MKKKFQLYLLTIFITFGVLTCVNAQDKFGSGYYVKTNGDTVVGLIRYQSNHSNSFEFKSSNGSQGQRITLDEATQFGFSNGPIYKKLDFGQEDLAANPVFAEVLFSGRINLYKYQANFFIEGSGKNRFKLAKSKVKDAEEAKKNYQMNIGYFNILFNDCPLFKMETTDAIIGEANLLALLKKYHACKSETFRVNRWRVEKTNNFGFFFGSNWTQISYSGINDPNYKFLERSKFEVSKDLTFGIAFLLKPRNPFSVLSLQNELVYVKGNFEATSFSQYQLAGYDIEESTQTSIKYAGVAYKVGPRITFRSNSLHPYFAFGLALPLAGSGTQVSTRTVKTNGVITTNEELETPATISNFWVSVGLKKKVFERHFVFAECIHDTKSGNNSAGPVSGVAIKLGILF